MKKFQVAKMFVVVGALALIGALPARASVPYNGTVLTGHNAAKDGNGVTFGNNVDVGYRVFVATASNSPIYLTDETGIVPPAGILNRICVSSGAVTEWAIAIDTNAATLPGVSVTGQNSGSLLQYETTPPINRVTTGEHCLALDAQWNNGLVILQSTLGGTGTTHIYWRPIRGGDR